jgi:hypothetical protein
MQVQDILNNARDLSNTPNTNNSRWSNDMLTRRADRAIKSLVARIYFPESRLTLTAPGNEQEFDLPEMHAIYRVYLNGQICVEVPGNVDTLEGDQIHFNDQTGQGAVPAGGGGAAGGTFSQPQWAIQTPLAYPYLNSWGAPSPVAQPWFAGQRPRYYRRGGYIGFVPAPTAGVIITIDCVRVPTTLTIPTVLTQTVVVPDNFMDAITYRMLDEMLHADRDQATAAIGTMYGQKYEQEVRRLRTWKRQYAIEDDQFQMLNYRGSYKIGGFTSGDYW